MTATETTTTAPNGNKTPGSTKAPVITLEAMMQGVADIVDQQMRQVEQRLAAQFEQRLDEELRAQPVLFIPEELKSLMDRRLELEAAGFLKRTYGHTIDTPTDAKVVLMVGGALLGVGATLGVQAGVEKYRNYKAEKAEAAALA